MADEHAAGRDLDLLIARRVMGYTVYHYDKDVEANCYYMLMTAALDPALVEWGGSYRDAQRKAEEVAWADCPPFSTDLAATWLVVARMRQHREFGNLHLVAYSYARTYASFAKYGFDDRALTAEANGEHATPVAICLAALLVCPEGEEGRG